MRSQCNGSNGASARRSTDKNNRVPSALVAKHAIVSGLAHPHVDPCDMPASSEAALSPSVTDPAMSNFTFSTRSVSGSSQRAAATPMKHSGAWTMKIDRHPTASTRLAPATTPITGAPALTKLQ